MSAYRSVLFDLGNVLSLFQPARFWDAMGIADPVRREEVGPRVLQLGRIYESGEIGTEEFLERFYGLFDGSYSHDRLLDAFLSVLPEPIAGMEDIVRQVGKRHEAALVSNTNPLHFALCLRTIPALKHLERYYVSYQLGVMKPKDEFYAGVIRGEGFPPSEMVFIDDLAENVDGARRAGFAAVLFRGVSDLEDQLRSMGVL